MEEGSGGSVGHDLGLRGRAEVGVAATVKEQSEDDEVAVDGR